MRNTLVELLAAIGIIVAVFLLILGLKSCTRKGVMENTNMESTDAAATGIYYGDTVRYTLLDQQTQVLGSKLYHCYLYADNITGIVYEIRNDLDAYGSISCTVILNADGTPMHYNFESKGFY